VTGRRGWPRTSAAGHRRGSDYRCQAAPTTIGVASNVAAGHVSSILTELHAPDRAAAILQARRAGFGKP
jgi:hypothetical protein